jgi:hypothetical protein
MLVEAPHMRRTVPFVIALWVTPALAGPAQAPIIGGTPAKVGDYPSVVAVEAGNGLCTGTLITKEWVLTAAHCVLPSELGVATQAQVTSALSIHTQHGERVLGGTTLQAQDSMFDPMFNINNLGRTTPASSISRRRSRRSRRRADQLRRGQSAGRHHGHDGRLRRRTAQGGGGSVGVEMVVNQTSVAYAVRRPTQIYCASTRSAARA